jgi:Tol biopolymer transport system component
MKTLPSGSPASKPAWSRAAAACLLGWVGLTPGPDLGVRKLNPPLARASVGNVVQSAVSPDGSRVVYLGYQDGDGDAEILSVPIDASQPPIVLSGTLAAGEVIQANGFLISPDGTRVVYSAGYDDHELYSAPIDGSASPVRLNGPLVANGDIPFDLKGLPARISPDSMRVVYVADEDTDEVFELFSVPIDGSASPTKLNGPFPTGTDIDIQLNRGFLIAPDGRVVYLARGYDYSDLYSVPIDGGQPPVLITQGTNYNHRPSAWSLTPDGASVVYAGNMNDLTALELFRAPIDGSQAPVRIGPEFDPGQNVLHQEISPDGLRVVYAADVTLDGVEYNDPVELFSVPLDASQPPIELNPPIVVNGSLDEGDPFEISPDGSRVVYLADQDTYGIHELYSVPIDGSQSAVKLSGQMVSGGDVGDESTTLPSFAITSDSARVVYRADQDTDEKRELYGVTIDGSASPVKLTSTIGSVNPFFTLTADGASCLFVGDEDFYGVHELFRVPVDGSTAPVQVSAPLTSGGDVAYEAGKNAFQVSSAGQVVYRAGHDEPGLFELYAAPLAGGGASTKLSAPFPPGSVVGRVYEAALSPDGRRAVYRAVQDHALELFSVPTGKTPEPAIRLNAPFTDEDTSITDFSPDSERVVFVQGKLSSSLPTIYYTLQSAPIDGSAVPVQLSRPGDSLYYTNGHEISADGTRVAFVADTDPSLSVTRYELFAAPIDGSQPTVRLNGPLAGSLPNGTAGFEISVDGARVVYRADQDALNVFELYAAPIDGSQAAVKLSGTLVGGGDVTAFALSPDSARAVFLADRDANDVLELYGVPLDASQPPVELSGALVAGGDVLSDFAISAGGFAVFRADKHVDDVIELYAVPVAGGSPPVELNLPLDAYTYRDVYGFRIAPDGGRVVYRANQDLAQRIELYSVEIEGGANPVKISGPEFSGGDLQGGADFAISADGERVVYLSDQLEVGVSRIYSTHIDGSRDPAELNGPLPVGGDVLDGFVISGDGRQVVYHADQDTNGVYELYRVSIDGARPPLKVNAPLVANGEVLDFSVSFHAERIVYRADQETNSIEELYLSFVPRPVAGAQAPSVSVSR